jgi:hypothetical protein
MGILPKAAYMFNAIPIKIPEIFLTEIEKVHMEAQKTLNSQGTLSKKNNTGVITIPDFKL